jgi:mRNA interferase MazF
VTQRQSGGIERALCRGAASDPPRLDRDAAFRLARPLLPVPHDLDLAAADVAAAPAPLHVRLEPRGRGVRGAQPDQHVDFQREPHLLSISISEFPALWHSCSCTSLMIWCGVSSGRSPLGGAAGSWRGPRRGVAAEGAAGRRSALPSRAGRRSGSGIVGGNGGLGGGDAWRRPDRSVPAKEPGVRQPAPPSTTTPIRRGDVWWVDLDPARGGEIRKTGPAVVITADALNRARLTAVVVPLSTGPEPRPPVVVATPSAAVQAVAVCDQLRAVDKRRFAQKLGTAVGGRFAHCRRRDPAHSRVLSPVRLRDGGLGTC